MPGLVLASVGRGFVYGCDQLSCCMIVTHTLLRKLCTSHSFGDSGVSRSLVEEVCVRSIVCRESSTLNSLFFFPSHGFGDVPATLADFSTPSAKKCVCVEQELLSIHLCTKRQRFCSVRTALP